MNRQTITPSSEDHWLALRAQDLTSTDIAALFGLSPYKTLFELWHEKKSGEAIKIADNERMKWGRRLESTVAHGIAEDMGWAIRPFKEYARIEGERVGASFDFRVLAMRSGAMTATELIQSHKPGGDEKYDRDDDAILEIKTVDSLAFRNGWTIEDGFTSAPPHIEIQVQHQMLVSGLKKAYIGVMVGGNDIRILEREADPNVHAGILAAARKFWASIDADQPPPPKMPDDAKAVIRLNQYAEPGKLFDARDKPEIAKQIAEYHRLKRESADLAELADVIKADILTAIGDAERVLVDGYSVSAGVVGPSLGTLVTPDMVGTYVGARNGYRNFRIQPKRTK